MSQNSTSSAAGRQGRLGATGRLLGLAFLLIFIGSDARAQETTRVVFTVDVESHAVPLPQQVDAVCTDGSACGLMGMAEMFRESGVAGTFFLNVYEHQKWGDAALRTMTRRLQAAGQDVGLHTHPQWVYDSGRNRMEQYDLEEQTAIVRDGVRLLAEWSGQSVVSHRAGDYGADERTLEALRRNGVVVDSSLFLGNPRSRLNGLGMPGNVPSVRGGVLQIPVTVYQRDAYPQLLGRAAAPVSTIRKIDPDWFVDEREAVAAIDAVVAARLPYLVVFLHSFSLLSPEKAARAPAPNVRSANVLTAMLEHVRARRLPVVTMRQIAASQGLGSSFSGRDVVPKVSMTLGLHRYAWQRAGSGNRRAVLLSAAFTPIAAAGALWLVLRRSRRAAHAAAGSRMGAPAVSGSKGNR